MFREGRVVVLDFTPADAARPAGFTRMLEDRIEEGRRRLIVRFRPEVELNAAALRALHPVFKKARLRLVDLRLAAPSEKLRQTLLLTRMNRYARVYGSLEKARRERGFMPLLKIGAAAACWVLWAAYAPVIRWILFSWRVDPYYSHGFLVAAVSLFLLWKRRAALRNPAPSSSRRGWALLLAALALYGAGSAGAVYFLKGISLILFLLGAVRLLGGGRLYRGLFLPVALLAFAVPLPRLEEAASAMQHFTAAWASRMVSALGVNVYSAGVHLFFGDLHIVIDAPCSGLRSLMALLFLGALAAAFLRAAPVRRAVLLLSVFPVAVAANLARITGLILVARGFGLEAAMLYFHYLSGLLLFAVAMAFLFLEAKALGCEWRPL